jgi:hypothetical protein
MCEKVTAEELETKKSTAKKSVRKLSFLGSRTLEKTKAKLALHNVEMKELPNHPDVSDESSPHVQNREKDIVTTELSGLKLGTATWCES